MAQATAGGRPEELNASWLTSALRAGGSLARAKVTSLDVSPLGEHEGTSGRLFRLMPTYDALEPTAPRSLIAKFPREQGPSLDIARRFRLYEREAHFYAEIAPLPELHTPQMYYAGANSDGDPILLLEDMAPAREGDVVAGCAPATLAPIVDLLAQTHARYWGSSSLAAMTWLPRPNAATTVAYSRQNYPRAWRGFRERMEALPPKTIETGERLCGDRSVLDRLSAGACTLTHGDLRLNNLIFSGDGRFVACIDWQSVTLARGPMDLASLLISNLRPTECQFAESELLGRYHARLMEYGVSGYSQDECWTDYRLAALTQFAGVVMLSAFLDLGRDHEETTAAIVGRPLEAARRLELGELLPRTRGGARLLARVRSVLPRR